MRTVGADFAKVRKLRTSPWAILIAGGAIATFIGFATVGSVLVTAINAVAGISARQGPSVTSSAPANVDVTDATLAIVPSPVIEPNPAANNVDKAVLKKATAECRAQVMEYARYHETSWWARHKLVKKCIADPNNVCRQC
jgi:hypothetical protein